MVYNLISCKRVIAKVMTDLQLNEGEHRISDMVEYCGESLEKIGGFPSFTNKVSGKDGLPLLEIVNYQTKLPCDFHNLIQLGYSASTAGPFYSMRYATGSFDSGVTDTTTTSTTYTAAESDLVTLAMSLYDLTYVAALAKINDEQIGRAHV